MYQDLVFKNDVASEEELLKEAMEYAMPFGMHKGTPIKILLVSRAGRSYLNWVMTSDARQHVKENIKIALDFYQSRSK